MMTMQDFLGTAPEDDQEDEIRKRFGIPPGVPASGPGSPILNINNRAFPSTPAQIMPPTSGPGSAILNLNNKVWQPEPADVIAAQPTTGPGSPILNINNRVSRPQPADVFADPSPQEKIANHLLGLTGFGLGGMSASSPPEQGPSLPPIYGFASQLSGPDKMIVPNEQGMLSTAQSPTGRITGPNGMVADAGPASSGSNWLGNGYFDLPENRLTAALGAPAAQQMMFHANTAQQLEAAKANAAMQLEQMRAAAELEKEKIRGEYQVKHAETLAGLKRNPVYDVLNNPHSSQPEKLEAVDSSNLPNDQKSKLKLSIQLTDPKNPLTEMPLTKAVEGRNPLSDPTHEIPFSELFNRQVDPRGENQADFSQLSKLAQDVPANVLNEFVTNRKVTPQMISNRLFDLTEKARYQNLLFPDLARQISRPKPRLNNLNSDQQRELDFILKKFGNPDVQKMSMADFLGGIQ